MELDIPGPLRGRALWAIFYLTLALLTATMLRPVWEGVAWAGILAAVTWPAFRRMRRLLKGSSTAAAIVMVLLVLAAIAMPLGLVLASLAREAGPAYESFMHLMAARPGPPEWLVNRIPAVRDLWHEILTGLQGGSLGDGLKRLATPGTKVLRVVSENLLLGGLALFTLFFFYRNGDRYTRQLRAAGVHLLGERALRMVDPTREALRAVFAGVILAAVAQGVVAGIGFAIVGLKAPIFFGVATAVLALIPFGAVVIWGAAAIGLFVSGAVTKAVIVVVWGLLFVSTVDNLVRPLVISGTTQLPYMQTFFSIIGGLAAFGLVGLFVGPAVLAVWLVLFREWVETPEDALVPTEAPLVV